MNFKFIAYSFFIITTYLLIHWQIFIICTSYANYVNYFLFNILLFKPSTRVLVNAVIGQGIRTKVLSYPLLGVLAADWFPVASLSGKCLWLKKATSFNIMLPPQGSPCSMISQLWGFETPALLPPFGIILRGHPSSKLQCFPPPNPLISSSKSQSSGNPT